MAHATTTPEAAILVPQGGELHEVYRGRIDDRYIALGRERPQAMHHDLEEAIRAGRAGFRERAAALRAETHGRISIGSEEFIRQDRDER